MASIERLRRGIQRRDFAVRARRGDAPEEEKPEDEEERDIPDKEEDETDDEEERSDSSEEEKDEDEPAPESGESGAGEDEHEPESGESGAGEDGDEEKEARSFVVEGYAATFGAPYQLMRGGGEAVFERIEPAAFAQAEMRDVVLQYDHAGRVFARQSNGTLELSLDARGLKVRANLGGTAAGRSLYEEIRGGYTTKMSFAFTIEESDFEELPEEEVLGFRTGSRDRYYLHTIRKIGRVYDVSAVSLPANEGTGIAARSGAKTDGARERLLFNISYAMATAGCGQEEI